MSACSASNDTLYGQGLREDTSTLSGFVAAPRHQVQDARDPVQQDDPAAPRARPGRTTARDTVFASYAQVQPGRQLAAPRRIVGSQPDRRPHQRATSMPTACSSRIDAGRLVVRQAVRGGPDAAHGQRDPGRHGAAVRTPAGRPGSTAATASGNHFWEDTNNNARVAFEPPPGIPRELYIPDLDARPDWRQIGSGSTLRHRRARRRLHEVLRGDDRDRNGGAASRSCAARTPGATTTATSIRTTPSTSQRRQHLHRLVEHRRRRGPPALEQQVRRPARRPPAHAEAVRLSHAAVERDRRRLRHRAVRPAVGGVELRAVHRARRPAPATPRATPNRLAPVARRRTGSST